MKQQLNRVAAATLLSHLPIATLALVFAFLEPDSSAWTVPDSHLDFNMLQWLILTASTQSLYLVICAGYLAMSICGEDKQNCALLTVCAIKLLNTVFLVSWLVIGAVFVWSPQSTYTPSHALKISLQTACLLQHLFIIADWAITFQVLCASSESTKTDKKAAPALAVAEDQGLSNQEFIRPAGWI